MAHLRIDFQAVVPEISLDEIVSHIASAACIKITADDWYAKRRLEEERTIEQLRQKGNPIRAGGEILKSIDRAAQSVGPTKAIMVTTGNGRKLYGRISREFTLLHSEFPIDPMAVRQLLDILYSLGIVKAYNISDLPSPPYAVKP